MSLNDLLRVISETMDIPKTYNNVYGIGPGSALDTEIMVYMKSRGWPERVQIGLLMGDMMETIEKKWQAEKETQAKVALEPKVEKKEKIEDLGLPEIGKPLNKGAGFWS